MGMPLLLYTQTGTDDPDKRVLGGLLQWPSSIRLDSRRVLVLGGLGRCLECHFGFSVAIEVVSYEG